MPQMMPSFWMILFLLCSVSVFVIMSVFLSFFFLEKKTSKSLGLSTDSWVLK